MRNTETDKLNIVIGFFQTSSVHMMCLEHRRADLLSTDSMGGMRKMKIGRSNFD